MMAMAEEFGALEAAIQATPAVVAIDVYREVPIYRLVIRTGSSNMRIYTEQIGTSPQRVASGSGFFVTSDGYIMTNNHVVMDKEATYEVSANNVSVPARVIYRDPEYDLALLKISGNNYPTITIADSSDVEIGQSVAGIGNSLSEDSISSGRVISLDESIIGEADGIIEELDGLIATDAKTYPGDSGGPLLDSNGQVIGVNVATLVSGKLSFSIPADMIRTALLRAGVIL
jgi:serine protease Do